MSNTLDNIMAKLLARGLLALRGQITMPRIVNSDYADEAAQKGQVINVPVPKPQPVTDVSPSNTPPAPNDTTPGNVEVPLDQWKQTDFFLSDKDMVEIDRNRHFLPMQTSEAISAIASTINAHIMGFYDRVPTLVGTPGTTPFATDTSAIINTRKKLHNQRCPKANRRLVLDFDAEANALALAQFADVEKVGERQVKIEGELGRKYGFDIFSDEDVPTHTAGTLTGDPTVTGANAEGATTVNVTTDADDAVDLKKGDVITIAGDSQTYAVTADTGSIGASTNVDVSIYPGLKQATTGGEALSVEGSHVVNLGFHRNAFAFAMRPLVQSTQDMALGTRIVSMQDPQTGLVMRLEVSRQHKQVVWSFDVLYGGLLVRPELATRLAG